MNSIIKTRIEEINSGKVPSEYKKTKVGIFPIEWEENTLGAIFKERKEVNCANLELLSITGEKGVIPRTEIEGKDNSSDDKSKYKKICVGDIGYNTMRMWQGVSALSKYEGIVSPAYTVLSPIKNICAQYYAYSFKLKHNIDVFYRHSQGLVDDTRSLKYEWFSKIVFAVPPLKEQEKIAEILKTQDRVIELKEKLLKEKQREKKYLMQQLLTGKIRLKGFTDEWRKNELGSLLDYIQPAKYIIKNDLYQNNGIPVITAGKSFILGFTNEKEDVFSAVPVIVFDDFTTGCQFVDFPFKCKSSAIKILTNHKNVNLLFIYEKMKKINYKVAGHERHWISKYSLLPIYIPSYEEQNAIAEIITTKDREIALIKQQIENEKQKKKALMQLLLSGIVRVS